METNSQLLNWNQAGVQRTLLWIWVKGAQALLVVVDSKSHDAQRINNRLKCLLSVCIQESGLEVQKQIV